MVFALVFPGQGSQSVGMMSAYGERAEIRDTFAEASDALGEDLWQMVSEGPAERLALTVNTQPLMLTAGVAAYRAWLAAGGCGPRYAQCIETRAQGRDLRSALMRQRPLQGNIGRQGICRRVRIDERRQQAQCKHAARQMAMRRVDRSALLHGFSRRRRQPASSAGYRKIDCIR